MFLEDVLLVPIDIEPRIATIGMPNLQRDPGTGFQSKVENGQRSYGCNVKAG